MEALIKSSISAKLSLRGQNMLRKKASSELTESEASRSEARVDSRLLAARLKSCPDASCLPLRVFPQPVKPFPFKTSTFSAVPYGFHGVIGLNSSIARWIVSGHGVSYTLVYPQPGINLFTLQEWNTILAI
jgi:hypothetical protein